MYMEPIHKVYIYPTKDQIWCFKLKGLGCCYVCLFSSYISAETHIRKEELRLVFDNYPQVVTVYTPMTSERSNGLFAVMVFLIKTDYLLPVIQSFFQKEIVVYYFVSWSCVFSMFNRWILKRNIYTRLRPR